MYTTVFPRSNTAATNFFHLLKLAAIIRGQRLLEGGDKNYYCIVIHDMNNEKFCSKFNISIASYLSVSLTLLIAVCFRPDRVQSVVQPSVQ